MNIEIKYGHGFTLIEVAMVMIIIGLMLAASIAPLSSMIERNKIEETDAILNDVMEALYGFAIANGRLPCPATALSLGNEDVATLCPGTAASIAAGAHGFVPGRLLGISGKYNDDELLLDAWNNPIRYSVTQSDRPNTNPATAANSQPDFTTANEMRILGINDLLADLIICSRFSGPGHSCAPAPPTNNTLATNAVAVLLSLGEDGARTVTGNDQLENAGEAGTTLVAALPPAGTGLSYQVAADRVFVSRSYKNTTTGTGAYKHQIKWMSPNTLYAKMIAAGQLP